MKVAVPIQDNRLDSHFGHAERFALLTLDDAGKITAREDAVPPPHEPGVLPRWLCEQGVNAVIAGGMGPRAVNLLEAGGVTVVTGAPVQSPETLALAFAAGTLVSVDNSCDHDHDGHGGHGGHSCHSS